MTNNKRKLRLVPLIILIALSFAFVVAIRQLGSGAGMVAPPTDAPIATARPAENKETEPPAATTDADQQAKDKDTQEVPGSKDAVAAYIRETGELPDYYVSKREASKLGWTGGSLAPYAQGKLIGGDRFGNLEGLLPKKAGRTWTECDIDTWGRSSRGAKRIVFSNDGLIYYTDDHYASFVELKEVP